MFIGEEPHHINAELGSIAPLVLMPGDPLRAKYIAEHYLEDYKEVCNLRNMLGYTGYYKGIRVSVVGSGMGMPSMGIYAWELFYFFKVEKIIRIGTCGGLGDHVDVPDLILAEAAYSESNFAYTYNDCKDNLIYSSKSLTKVIKDTASDLGYKIHVGNLETVDVYGPYIDFKRVLERIPKDIEVIGEEMESFALFHIANDFKKDAACIVTVVDSNNSDKVLTGEERQNSLHEMMTLALESIIK